MSNNKRRILSAFCASVIAAGIAGCSESPDRNSSSAETSSIETTAPEAETSAPETTTTEAPTETEAPDTTTTEAEPETPAESSGVTPAMWKITTDNGNTITLLGSMHALSEDDYPLPSEITTAFEESDVLAVEIDIIEGNDLAYQISLMQQMKCEEGKVLSDYISGEAYDALDAYLKTFDLSINAFENYRPWAVAITLDSLPMQYTDLKYDLGIDDYLLSEAKKTGKEIHEVETLEFQTSLIVDVSDELYDLMFRSYEGSCKDDVVKGLEELHEAWASGDLDTINEQAYGDEDAGDEELSEEDAALVEEYVDMMYTSRNKGMEEDIKELMKGDKDVFFVVGAAHYVGEDGIIDLLEKDGIEYERIEYK